MDTPLVSQNRGSPEKWTWERRPWARQARVYFLFLTQKSFHLAGAIVGPEPLATSLPLPLCHSCEVFKTGRHSNQRWRSGDAGSQCLVGSSGPPRDLGPQASSTYLSLPPPFSSSSSLSESLLDSPEPLSLLLLLSDSLSDSGSVEESGQASLLHVKPPPPVMKALPTAWVGLSGSMGAVWVPSSSSELKL